MNRRLRWTRPAAAVILACGLGTCNVDQIIGPKGPSLLRVAPAALADSAATGATARRTLELQISNGGSGSLSWSAAAARGSPWLSLSPDRGDAPGALTVWADASGLAPGLYRDTVVVTAPATTNGEMRVPVEFNVFACRVTPLSLGTEVSETLQPSHCAAPHRAGSQARLYAFIVARDDSVSIVLTSTAFDPYLYWDSTAAASAPPLAEADVCAAAPASACLRYRRVPYDGTFLIEATTAAPGGTGAFTLRVTRPRAPGEPQALEQLDADTAEAIPPDGTTGAAAVVARATVTDPDLADTLRLEVEAKPVGTPFTGAGTSLGAPVPSGARATVRLTGLTDGTAYHWRARARDQTGRAGPWVSFGGPEETVADFRVHVQRVPLAPAGLAQFKINGTTAIPTGGVTDEQTVVLAGTVNDPNPSDLLRLEVEVKPTDQPFTGAPDAASTQVAPGAQARVSVTGLRDAVAYRWRARTRDQAGAASAWVEFGGNAAAAPDFRVALPVARLAFTVQPGPATAGQPITPAVEVRAQDAAGSTIASFEGPVTLSFAVNPTSDTLSGTTTVNAVAGVATFADVRVRRAANGYALAATAPGLPGVQSAAFNVSPGPASRLAFTRQPSTTVAGAPVTPAVRVAAQDQSGNTVPGFTGSVTVALGSNPGGAALTGATATAVAGVATFGDLALDRTGSGYTLVASAAGVAAATSVPFDITPGNAAALAFTASPTTVQAGATITPPAQVTARDRLGNTATGFAGDVTVALAAGGGEGGATLGGRLVVQAVSGVATWNDLTVDRSGTGYTLGATADGLTAATSAPFDVTPAAASQVTLTTHPGATAQSGQPLAPQPVTQLRDALGNAVSQSGVVVTASVASGPAGATLSGATATTDGAGRAAFTALTVTGPTGTYTLGFGAPGLSPATSQPVTVTAGAASALTVMTQPSPTAQSGVVFTQQPAVRIHDNAGNPVPLSGVAVTAAIATGGGALGGAATVPTDAAGVAAFTDLVITGTQGPRTLRFTATDLTAAISEAVQVDPGPAAQIVAQSTTSQTAPAGSPVPAPPAVRVTDASDNPAAGVLVTFTVDSGGGTVTPADPVASGADGVAAVASWVLGTGAGANVVRAAAPGLAGSPVTFRATGTVGPPAALTKSSGDSLTGPVGSTLETPHEVLITDANGNPVSGVTVTWRAAAGGGSVNPASSATDTAGHARTTRTLGPLVGTQTTTATATIGGAPRTVTFTITATAAGASQMTIAGGDGQVGEVGTTLPESLAVRVSDQFNNPVPGVTVTWSITNGGGSVAPGSSTTGLNGIARTSWTLGQHPTAQTARATAAGSPVNFVATATVGPVDPARSSVTASPSTITASSGSSASTITVTARDQYDNAVPGAPVAPEASGTGNVLTPAGGNTNSSGVFTSTLSSTVAEVKTITATAGGVTLAARPTVTVGPAAAARLAYLVEPAGAASGQPIAPPVEVEVRDGFGNRVTSATNGVTIALGANPPGGSLGGDTFEPAVNGVATFADLRIDKTGSGYTLLASTAGLAADTSAPFTITPGAPTQLTITIPPPSAAQSGKPFGQQPVVQLRDANGNPVSQSGVGVTAVIAPEPGGASLTNAAATTGGTGAASFSGLTLSGPTGSYTLRFESPGLAPATSGAITLGAGDAAALTIVSTNPQSATAGSAVGSPPAVRVTDASGNPVAGVAVTFAVTSGGGAVDPTTAVTTGAGGIAAAKTWTLGPTAGTNTLTATAAGSGISGNPATFTATGAAGAATQLTLTTPPSATAQSGAPLAQQPVVQLRDANENAVSQAGVTVNAVIASGPAGATLTSATATTAGTGAAPFSGLTLTGPVGDYTLRFEAGTLTPATSGTVTLGTGAATQLTITTPPPSSAQSGQPFFQQPVIQLRDGSGNPVSQPNVAVTAVIASGPGGASLTNATATTGGTGQASFTGLTLTGPVGDYTLRFEAGTLSPATSGTITLGAGTPTRLTITTPPSSSAQSGQAFVQQPVIQLRDGGGNPVSQPGVAVTAVIASGPAGATLGSATATTTGTGAAPFSGLTLTGPAGDYTLRFEAGTLTPATSGTISLGAGTPTQLTITTPPSSAPQSGQPFAQQPVIQLRDASGNPASQAGVTVNAVIASGPGGASLTNAAATPDGSGAAAFSGLTLSGPAGSYTLRFEATGLSPVTSGTITLSAGPAASLAVTSQPTAAAAGVPFDPAVEVTARDQFGNTATSFTGTVSLAMSGGTAGAKLYGPKQVGAVQGVARFGALAVDSGGAGYVVNATSGTLQGATSTPIEITPAPSAVIVGAGDIASCTSSGDEATAALLDGISGTVFTTGDHAYPNGTLGQFDLCYHPTWGRHKARTRPAVGNHEYDTPGALGYFTYWGAAAGDADKGYYSYDLGGWHVVVLNSEIAKGAGSPQEQWLRADLAANPRACTLAYWHEPRFSSGAIHGSSTGTQALWQALYEVGAELVLAGDEHVYERFAPQTPTGVADPAAGIRQITIGTGGGNVLYGFGPPLPTTEERDNTAWGVLKVTLYAGSYTWEFVPVAGKTFTDSGVTACH